MYKQLIPIPKNAVVERKEMLHYVIKCTSKEWKIHIRIEKMREPFQTKITLEIWNEEKINRIKQMYEEWKKTFINKITAWIKEKFPNETLRIMLNHKKYFCIIETPIYVRKKWIEDSKEMVFDILVYGTQSLIASLFLSVFFFLLYLPVGLILNHRWGFVFVPIGITFCVLILVWCYQICRVMFKNKGLESIFWHINRIKRKKQKRSYS